MIEKEFPFQPKPVAYQLTNQGQEDCICRYIVEHMTAYNDPVLPIDGVRYLHSELANLSSKGMSWLLPNLLRKAVLCENRFDTITDTLIFDLEKVAEGDIAALNRYSHLSSAQVQCIESVLEFLSEKHGHAISSASQALRQLSA